MSRTPNATLSVCVCTFKRPALLVYLLSQIVLQKVPDGVALVEIIVVDNDPVHSALAVLQDWVAPAGFALRFFHVAQPNIATARNTAIEQASGRWLAFIDDDEAPEDDWLQQLMLTLLRFNADAVFAPIVPRYGSMVAPWLIKGAYFDRPRHPTGTVITQADARTGNVLIKADCLKSVPGPFDASFGRTGGEDSLLFNQLLHKGHIFVWCDEAPVSENVPLERANAAWLIKRSYRIGQTWIRAQLYQMSFLKRMLKIVYLLVKSSLQLLISLVLALLFLPVSLQKSFSWFRIAMTQLGKLTGLTGFNYKEYGG
jgi:succinoglycan biosynthesis protein ExoM